MAHSKDSSCSPEFIQELLLSAERTALLYHLSYLCLGNFPELERLIRKQALDTQLLYGSSEALLLKCVGTSSNLDSSLFPILRKVVEKNKPFLGEKYLEKARTWINDIIRAADDIVTRYNQHSQSVAMCAIDVIQEQKQNEKQLTQRSEEMKSLEKEVAKLKEELRKQNGVLPSSVHLEEVQMCLSRIQQILVQLQKFWEKVGTLLDSLKDRTFAGEDLIEDLDDLKEEFLTSIEAAGEYWKTFGGCCRNAQSVFSVQSKDAYKFLEINPSSLSEKERKEQYKSVMEKLKQISHQESSTATFTE